MKLFNDFLLHGIGKSNVVDLVIGQRVGDVGEFTAKEFNHLESQPCLVHFEYQVALGKALNNVFSYASARSVASTSKLSKTTIAQSLNSS